MIENTFSEEQNTEEAQQLLEGLNEQQREAVLINDGSLLVFAGAGSGKTRVITTKIAWAEKILGINPGSVLAVTFTNKACREMQDRVKSLVGEENARNTVIKTFHSFGVWLLRRYADKAGLDRNFRIYDEDDCTELLGQCFPEYDRKTLNGYVRKISVLKDKMKKPSPLDERLCQCYKKYQQMLQASGNVDFADMISKTIELLRSSEEVRSYIHRRFRVILVDEYQDSNTAQFELLSMLKSPDAFVCVVGDDDQSIYRFRGAEVRNILDFPNVFPNVRTVVLGKNYRCSQAILNVAKDIIAHNKMRASKTLESFNDGGVKPCVVSVNSEYDEAQFVVDTLKRSPVRDYGSTAVLYRTNAQSKAFEDRFIMNSIPYVIVGALRFYDREEIRDCISVISMLLNPHDSVSFSRMVNKPPRGIGETSVDRIIERVQQNPETDIPSVCRSMVEEGALKGASGKALLGFLDKCETCTRTFGSVPNSDFLKAALESLDLIQYYAKRDLEENSLNGKRTANINQLVNMLADEKFCNGIDGINTLMEYIALDPNSLADGSLENSNANADAVTLITMHNTKGLEYDRVFVTGMEQEIFPSRVNDATTADIEEERRICYVAVTRARSSLYLTHARYRSVWGHSERHTPSMFLKEIEKNHVQEIDLCSSGFRQRSAYSSFNSYDRFRDGDRNNGYGDSWGSGSYNGYNSDKSYDYSGFRSQTESKQPEREYKSYLIKASGSNNNVSSRENRISATVKKTQEIPAVKAPEPAKGASVYNKGDRIRSGNYGDGTVTDVRVLGGRGVVDVRFDSGKTGSFAVSRITFEKI